MRAVRSPLILVASAVIAAAGCTASSAGGDPGPPEKTGTANPICATAYNSRATGPQARVTNISMSNHGSFDTVVFDITSATRPGYRALYADGVLTDGQGRPLPLSGKEVIGVFISPPDEAGGGATNEGVPTDLKRDYRGLLEVRSTGGSDGYVTYGLGVAGKDGFRVLLHKDSSTHYRLQVDVAHAGARPWSNCGR